MSGQGPLLISTSPAPAEIFTGALPESWRAVKADADELRRLAPEADIIVGDWEHRIQVDREVIELAQGCRLIQQPSAGYENIDVVAAAEAGIPVANAGPANAAAVAEHAIMLALGCVKQLREQIADTERGGWDQRRWIDKDLGDLGQATVGILGFGQIGQAIAERLKGFGSEVLYHKRNRLEAEDEARLGAGYADLASLLGRSQVLVITLPLSDETRGLIGAEALQTLPQGAVVINVARGAVVDEAALARALRSGHLGGAGLDVFSQEPLPKGHDLAALPNVLLTPHVGGATAQSKRNILLNSFANISRVASGQEPLYVVNRPVGLRPAPA